jgi:hypothetical protein
MQFIHFVIFKLINVAINYLRKYIYYKHYVSGHYPPSCLYVKHRPVYNSKHNVSDIGLCLYLQVKPTQPQSAELVPVSGHLYQHKVGVYKLNTAPTICES